VNGKIYVFGGSNNDDSTDSKALEYDPKTDTWTKKADMPTSRFLAAAGVVNGKIYVIGGGEEWNDQWDWPVFSAVEEYDPAMDTWTKKTDMPTARDGLSASVLDGKIYAIGGVPDPVGPKKREGYTSVVEEYDPETDMWRRAADMTVTRRYLSTATLNGRIYATGGTSEGIYLSTVEVYTLEDWQAVSPRGKLATSWGEVKQ
jgi:N-acetylneuraminic acid mutarotase